MLAAYIHTRATTSDGAGPGPLPTSLTAAPCLLPRRSRKESSTTGPARRYGLPISAIPPVPLLSCLGTRSGSCCRSFAVPAAHFPISSSHTPLSTRGLYFPDTAMILTESNYAYTTGMPVLQPWFTSAARSASAISNASGASAGELPRTCRARRSRCVQPPGGTTMAFAPTAWPWAAR
jgi:hypothetical protein